VTYRIKQHDLEPPLVIDVSGSAGDLSTVASWKVVGKRGSTVVFSDTDPDVVVNDPPTSAVVSHSWAAGETDTVGVISIEVEATWPGDRPQTFPPSGYNVVRIEPDLG
jgi:hypothetical protein